MVEELLDTEDYAALAQVAQKAGIAQSSLLLAIWRERVQQAAEAVWFAPTNNQFALFPTTPTLAEIRELREALQPLRELIESHESCLNHAEKLAGQS